MLIVYNMPNNNLWTRDNDLQLWNERSKPTVELADIFGRSNGGIRSRIKHLKNPDHKAYQRLFGTTSMNPAVISSPPQQQQHQTSVTSINRVPVATANTNHKTTHDGDDDDENNIVLNPEQNAALHLVLTGKNVYLTGAAGVGKTFLLRRIVSELTKKYNIGNGVAVTASTGIAASHLPSSATTLHSFAGIGLGGRDVPKLIQKVMNNSAAYNRWRMTRTLVIDEISMIDGVLFQTLDIIGKTIRGNQTQPFGGLQLVLCGDFFQLPPVSLRYGGFSFSSVAWERGNIHLAELKTVIRQEGDLSFVRILRQLREGKCSKDTEALLATCHVSKKRRMMDGIVPTKLYCTNKNVDAENTAELQELTGRSESYRATDKYKESYPASIRTTLQQSMEKKLPSILQLKIGAQVMLLKNMPEWKLVNGSRGVVIDFDKNKDNKNNPLIRFANNSVRRITPFEVFQATSGGAMTREQLPIKLAWCLTVHKSQGMTLDRLELQLDDAFDYGQVYVALSRVTSLNGLWIKGKPITQKIVKAHPDVIEFHNRSIGYQLK